MKKAFRVKKNREFERIITKKKSAGNKSFVVYCDLKQLDHVRVGISVSKKLGNAVERNRIKRQVREMVKQLVDFNNCEYDLIIIVKKGFLDKDFNNNKKDLETTIKKAII